jgi:hypothetical protein
MKYVIGIITALVLSTSACAAPAGVTADIKAQVAAVDCTDAAKAEPKAEAVAKLVKQLETEVNATKPSADLANLVGIAVADGDKLVKYTKSAGQCKLQVKMMTRNLDNIQKMLEKK